MRLDSFSVTNFRSINDSGKVDVAQITALLGRNESGKSNLLRALDSLNPAEGFEALNPIKDFPRHRRLEECNDRTKVVTSRWILDDEDKAELMAILPRAGGVTHVDIGRYYGAERWVSFIGLTLPRFHIHQDIDMLTVYGGNGNEQSDDAASGLYGGVQDGGG